MKITTLSILLLLTLKITAEDQIEPRMIRNRFGASRILTIEQGEHQARTVFTNEIYSHFNNDSIQEIAEEGRKNIKEEVRVFKLKTGDQKCRVKVYSTGSKSDIGVSVSMISSDILKRNSIRNETVKAIPHFSED